MHVIGTAGHVDHGKSTLVEALTGINPDRLKEEQERAMTIDLGFAWMPTGDGEAEVGIVDVPGHRDFIENMLAGVGGIDLALLVIAADEGVMPQTKEHLAILDLLQIPGGVVALTKVDLVDDPDWLELVTLDVLETLAGTTLADATVIQVSATTGQGLAELRQTILDRIHKTPRRPDLGRPRLPIDRTFSMSGFGTIVTGTLLDGHLHIGDQVEVQPGGEKGRIRGLQTHRTKLDTARPGSRVAVNLAGISRDSIARGDVVAYPDTVQDTILCDVSYRHLEDAPIPLKHNMEVKLYVGSAEVVARTRVLGQRLIAPGEHGWLQLALRQPIVISRGDRFVLRRPSPPSTIGGGKILDPHPGRRHRRFRSEVVAHLETLAKGTPTELLLQTAAGIEPARQEQLIDRCGLPPEVAQEAWQQLRDQEQLLLIDGYVYTSAGWQRLRGRLIDFLGQFHENYPLRMGVSREELRSRLKTPPVIYNALLNELMDDGLVIEQNRLLHLSDHAIRFSASQQEVVDKLLVQLEREGVNSTSVKEVRAQIGEDLYQALVDLGELVQISDDVVYPQAIYEDIVDQIRRYLQREGKMNVAQLRDLSDTSRKYAIAILEHLDDIHVTKRQGDYRILVA